MAICVPRGSQVIPQGKTTLLPRVYIHLYIIQAEIFLQSCAHLSCSAIARKTSFFSALLKDHLHYQDEKLELMSRSTGEMSLLTWYKPSEK